RWRARNLPPGRNRLFASARRLARADRTAGATGARRRAAPTAWPARPASGPTMVRRGTNGGRFAQALFEIDDEEAMIHLPILPCLFLSLLIYWPFWPRSS